MALPIDGRHLEST